MVLFSGNEIMDVLSSPMMPPDQTITHLLGKEIASPSCTGP